MRLTDGRGLTGVAPLQVLGRNCSFLQLCPADAQPGAAAATAAAAEANCEQLAVLRAALGASPPRAVTCVLHNFKRCGMPFLNVLHVAPIRDAGGESAAVGDRGWQLCADHVGLTSGSLW